MKLTKAGQFVNVDTREVENVLDFDNGIFILVITDEQYQSVLSFLQGAKKRTPREEFYIDENKINKQTDEEDGINQL